MKGFRNKITKFQPPEKGRERKRKRKNTTNIAMDQKSMIKKQNFGKRK